MSFRQSTEYTAPSGAALRVSPSEEWRMRSADEAELRVHPPNIEVDNMAADETLITVECANRSGILLEMVTTLTELDLVIRRATISSDGGWFVDAFYVTTADGSKVMDEEKLERIRQMLSHHSKDHAVSLQERRMETLVELAGIDRPGLLSDVSAVVTAMRCNVQTAAVWTQRARVALLLCVESEEGGPIRDAEVLEQLRTQLVAVLGDGGGAHTCTAHMVDGLRAERRLHTLMLGDDARQALARKKPAGAAARLGPFAEGGAGTVASRAVQAAAASAAATQALQQQCIAGAEGALCAAVGSGAAPESFAFEVFNCTSTGYSVVRMRCKDRPKLLFDTVCTLADLDFDIYHAAIETSTDIASQEYYVLHRNGQQIEQGAECDALRQHFADAIERRALAAQGHRLQVVGLDRPGLLATLCTVLREGGLSITKAEVETVGDKAVDTFYLTDASGCRATREALRTAMGRIDELNDHLKVSYETGDDAVDAGHGDAGLGSFLRNRLGHVAAWVPASLAGVGGRNATTN